MKGALWSQLPPSQVGSFYCSRLLDNKRTMLYKRTIMVQEGHPGPDCKLNKSGSYLKFVLALLISLPL